MEAFNKSYFIIFRRFTIMTKKEFFEKAKELKDKAAEKTRPTREKVKAKLDDAYTWVSEHKGAIAGAAVGALFIHVRGYLKGWSDGRVQEHSILEQRYDTAMKFALKKAGMTEEEADTFDEVQDLVNSFGGVDEVRCLLEEDYDTWCALQSSKKDEEEEEDDDD
jgi:hypothetical protein